MPESKIRVVCGDIGGSFGMKSAVYNEVALVLLGAKVTGRPVKWTSTRSEAFVGDAQARDNVTTAELALDRDGHFLGFRVITIANLGAYLQTGGNVFVGNLGTLAGVYRTPAMYVDVTGVFTNTNPMRPFRGNGRPEAAYVIERMVDLAAAELGIDAVELRRRNFIPSASMPFKTGLTFTYDCGEFERSMDMALDLADHAGFAQRRDAARKRGKLRGIGLSNSIERAAAPGFEGAEIRFDRGGTVTLVSGSITQGQGHETIYKQLVCDRLGIDPANVHYVQGDTDKVFFAEGTGGSRSATLGGSAFLMATEKIIAKGKRIAAKMLGVGEEEVSFADGMFSSAKSNRTLAIAEIARESLNPRNLPQGAEPGLIETAIYTRADREFPQRDPCLRARDRRGDRRGRDAALQRRRRCRHGDESAAARGPDHRRRGAGRGPGADGGYPLRSRLGAAPHRLVHGLRDAARRRPLRIPHEEQPGADQDQSAGRQGRGRGGLRRRAAGGVERAGECAVGAGHPPHRHAGHARSAMARDRRGEAGLDHAKPVIARSEATKQSRAARLGHCLREIASLRSQ